MSILSILLLLTAIVSFFILMIKKKLPLPMQRIIFFGFFGIVICCIPEYMQFIFYYIHDEWLAVLFANWFNKDTFALMCAKALAWLIICGAVFLVVWLLWLLHKKISNNGLRRLPITIMTILLILGIAYAEYGNGAYTFTDMKNFLTVKTAYNMQLPIIPNKITMKNNSNPATAKCEAEGFDLFTDPDNHDMLQLQLDGEVYIWRSNAAINGGYYPL